MGRTGGYSSETRCGRSESMHVVVRWRGASMNARRGGEDTGKCGERGRSWW